MENLKPSQHMRVINIWHRSPVALNSHWVWVSPALLKEVLWLTPDLCLRAGGGLFLVKWTSKKFSLSTRSKPANRLTKETHRSEYMQVLMLSTNTSVCTCVCIVPNNYILCQIMTFLHIFQLYYLIYNTYIINRLTTADIFCRSLQ